MVGVGREELAPGLSIGDWRTLYALARSEPVMAKWLSVEMGRTQQQTAHFVKRLVRARLVRQAPDPRDSRRKLLTLTDEGRRLEHLVTDRARTALARLLR
ncbi:MarR family winged helix-turn-helix transcriptional regulator [Phenylobacterium sp.]|mgnify:CR=1 FL=1|uniref:MarR family winged helix-turn-helix transcriptional regulator n=1 Tax=Phenylobacterium sp. TaxID=1871053 RepID=UPI002FE1B417